MSAPGGRNRRPGGRLAVLAPVLLAAACQPLPHPFADDRPPAALLKVPDVAGVSVAPIAGAPGPLAKKLGAAVATALLKRDIPASDRTSSLGSYQLYGRIGESHSDDSGMTVTAAWRLDDAKGRTVGQRKAEVTAPVQEWGSDSTPPIERLAGLIADGIRPLIEDEAPSPAPTKSPAISNAPSKAPEHASVAIGTISGAPGDGAKSLAAAVAAVLTRQDLTVVAAGQKADLTVDCAVSVSPSLPGKQHVKIVWRVRRADGSQIGNVAQENDVPRGELDGRWGDLAYNVAIAAGDGLMQLIARGLPRPKA